MFENLIPRQYTLSNGATLSYFQSSNLPLVKLDFTFEAGTRYQEKKCLASAANHLICKADASHTTAEAAEFLDFRGIVIERSVDDCAGSVSCYFLRQYAEELFPLLRDMFVHPVVTEQAFAAHVAKRRMQLQSGWQKTSYRARNAFYEALFGAEHPLGGFATPESLDALTIDDVRRFQLERYRLDQARIVASGDVDEQLLGLLDRYLGSAVQVSSALPSALPPSSCVVSRTPIRISMPNAVQSTIRVGRVLPFGWNSEECSRFTVLNTLLGGYFGSRLMSNLREDKGYTYGIYSQMQIYRGPIVFYITADVAAESTEAALGEIRAELERLRHEAVDEDELKRVCSYLRGDFLRNIDGIFEISERYRQMEQTGCDERFTERFHEALRTTTPQQLQQLAQQMFEPCRLTTVVAGPCL